MRQQTIKMQKLLNEYKELKKKIFGDCKFAILCDNETEQDKRYNQLHQYFHPQFRTKDFINPMEENK